MASSAELRQKIAEGHKSLRAAIEAAAGRWEQTPNGNADEWSPRQAAEHCLGSDVAFAGWVAGVMLGKAPERKDLAFPTAQDALNALSGITDPCERVYAWVEDRDLQKRCAQIGNISSQIPATLEGALQLAAYHLNDHAGQISRG